MSTTQAEFQDRQECEEAVARPGKFEGERPYVPYFWSLSLEGGADEVDEDDVMSFVVQVRDAELFPELSLGQVICIRETDQGFVIEVPALSYEPTDPYQDEDSQDNGDSEEARPVLCDSDWYLEERRDEAFRRQAAE